MSKNSKYFLGSTLAALLLISACVVSDEQPTEEGGEDEDVAPTSSPEENGEEGEEGEVVASSATSSTDIGGDLIIDVYPLEDVGNGLLRLSFGITNNSDENHRIYRGLSDDEETYTASALALLDPVNANRHMPYRQDDDSCFCSEIEGTIGSGETEEMWVIFPAPAEDDVEEMAVTTPLTPPIFDIPIVESSETVENSGLKDGEILPLTTISDDLDDQTGRTESDDEVSILLSSDVLFDTDSADLSSEAQEILEQVATEIDDVSADSVEVDGHADDTGTDDINEPLSLDRAEAVESVLADLVAQSGVDFDVEGHGSADPIATNETEEGRERNRRVSVTFEK